VAPIDVKAKIEAALKRNAILDAQHIKVQAVGGKVTLTGTVSSWAESGEAEDAAWGAPGVTEVKNLITINYDYELRSIARHKTLGLRGAHWSQPFTARRSAG
jgi:hypothetical protein